MDQKQPLKRTDGVFGRHNQLGASGLVPLFGLGRSVHFGAELGEDRLDRGVLFCLLTSTLRLGTGIHGLLPCALQLLFEGSAGSASENFGWSTAFMLRRISAVHSHLESVATTLNNLRTTAENEPSRGSFRRGTPAGGRENPSVH